jgi:hypothetical protein
MSAREGLAMTIPEILAELKRKSGKCPHQAITEAVAQREAIIPELLRMLEEDTENLAEIAPQGGYLAHLYAMFLLAQFREPRAYPLLVKFFRAEYTLVDMAVADVMTDGLDRMLASTCHGDTSLIEGMIEDATLDEYIRSAALGALGVLVVEGEKSRDEVMAYFAELFRGKLEREFSYVWAYLVSKSCDLYPEEVLPDIEQAFAEGLIDTGCIGKDWVERTMAAGKERTLAKLGSEFREHFIMDTIKEMGQWACYKASGTPATTPLSPLMGIPAPVRTAPKVGRNEPCPCGSGKKYKRCCGG